MLMAMHDLKEPYVKWSTEMLRHQQLEGAAEGLRVHVEVVMSTPLVRFSFSDCVRALV